MPAEKDTQAFSRAQPGHLRNRGQSKVGFAQELFRPREAQATQLFGGSVTERLLKVMLQQTAGDA